MKLIPKRQFRGINDFFNEDDWFFPDSTEKKFAPEMDIYETENMIIAEISVPGVSVSDLGVKVEGDLLRVSGIKEEENENKGKGYYRKEIAKGSFERVVRLPANIDIEKVKANYRDGILMVELPKKEQTEKQKTIPIELGK